MSSIFHAGPRSGDPALIAPFGAATAARVRAAIGACPEYATTPLRRMPAIARDWGLREVWAKDERARLGLRSFKALGGAYAVLCLSKELLSRQRGAPVAIEDVLRNSTLALADVTFTAATAGNHGCSVAAGAKLVGARSCIFVTADAPAEQVRAIAAQGAHIVQVAGCYEDSLEACRSAAESNGWIVVSDCAAEAHDATVRHVMEGYTVIAAEILAANNAPTHVFLQAGVGGMAAAVAAHLVAALGNRAPKVIVVEPESAACLQASARADRAVTIRANASDHHGPSGVLRTVGGSVAGVARAGGGLRDGQRCRSGGGL